jgi:glycerophosphoryl diester phosphodiesterase
MKPPLIFGHRGVPHEATENTIASFERAIELGIDGIELDIHRTKDNQLIVVHNAEFSLEGQPTQYVFDYSYDDLRSIFPDIPLLQSVFDLCRSKIDLEIEIKRQDKLTIELCIELVRQNSLEFNTELTSSHPVVLAEVKRANSSIKTGLIFEPFPQWMKGKHQIVSVLDALKIIKADTAHIRIEYLNEELAQAIKREGYQVHSGSVDSKELLEKSVELGVDKIITNQPRLAIEYYKEKE